MIINHFSASEKTELKKFIKTLITANAKKAKRTAHY